MAQAKKTKQKVLDKNQILTIDYFEQTLDRKLDEKLDKKLDEKLKNYPTKKYLDKRLKKFITKQYLDKYLDKKFKSEFNAFEKKIDQKFKDQNNKIMTMLDQIIGELRDMRQEMIIMNGRQSIHSNTLENHEGRIKNLEKTSTFNLNSG